MSPDTLIIVYNKTKSNYYRKFKVQYQSFINVLFYIDKVVDIKIGF